MRLRVRFAKQGKVRFTSHRDVARIWERALRKADIALSYSEGFSPRPKLSFGLALPTGYESLGEYLDVDITDAVDPDSFPARLDPALPVGFHVQRAVEIAPGTPSLQQSVLSCTWRIEVTATGPPSLAVRAERLLAADALVATRERKGRRVTDDLRPAILGLEVRDGSCLVAELATSAPRGDGAPESGSRGLRPCELVALLGDAAEEGRSCRLHQWMLIDGALAEPISLAALATSTPHAEARAS